MDNRNKEIVIILSHCDNQRKVDKLKKCVNVIKEQGYPIIISSHIKVPDDFFPEVDYIVCDSDNPVINNMDSNEIPSGAPNIWFKDDSYYQVSYVRYNYSYAVMKLMKSSAGVAYANGYEKIHFINYDYVINDPGILKKHLILLEKHDIVGYNESYEDQTYFSTGIFSVNAQPFVSASNSINSKSDFLSYGQPVLEKFIHEYYHKKAGLSIENSMHIDTIKNSCEINTEATFNGIIDGFNGIFYLFFAKDEVKNSYYISTWVNSDSSKQIFLTIDNKKITVDTLPFNQKTIIDVTEIIKSGKVINVSVPEYQFTDQYHLLYETSYCEILNKDIVKNIDSFDSVLLNDVNVKPRTFSEISNSFGSDKSWYHKYDKVYPDFLERFRNESFNLFEIGIEAGGSFKLWQEYFPYARIYGMDIGVAFKNERGEVFIGDQSKKEDLERIANTIKDKCKVIIDDGSHVAEHQLKTFYYFFENLLDYGGVYIIEDIECSYWKPEVHVYGYESGHFNIIDYFTKLNHTVNSHYSLHVNNLNIKSITFASNCIIVTKKTEQDIIEDSQRFYRFGNLL
jgi:hypothetical protein